MFIALGIGLFTVFSFALTGFGFLYCWGCFGSKSSTPPLIASVQ
ncbi:hypothetical protein MHSWG343_01110 [Candidatus Mycoplasma haematohominis]|uniref:Uncharacterized protein n=1 Tax=Candidatus Mycoplasma haematohominis TaxID=1494318 RepID=A0A478FP93_9MOLU|nr:hypothetical protein MHSWG343_01110 [Candidatus Mycoplasma haemohominis]